MMAVISASAEVSASLVCSRSARRDASPTDVVNAQSWPDPSHEVDHCWRSFLVGMLRHREVLARNDTEMCWIAMLAQRSARNFPILHSAERVGGYPDVCARRRCSPKAGVGWGDVGSSFRPGPTINLRCWILLLLAGSS